MTRLKIAGVVLAVGLLSAGRGVARQAGPPASPEVLMGQALHQEEVEDDARAAIATYARVIADSRSSRKLVATALLYTGRCYERLGESASRSAYERILREFQDQTTVSDLARAKLGRALGGTPLARTAIEQIWTLPAGSMLVGSVSRNGRYVPYLSNQSGVPALTVRDLTSGSERQVPLAREQFQPVWVVVSPDGGRLAVLGVGASAETPRLYLVDLPPDGDPRVRPLPDRPSTWIFPVDWSPDGRSIAVGLFDGTAGQVGVLSVPDGTIKVLKTIPDLSLDALMARVGSAVSEISAPVQMAFSPDGKYLAFDRPAGDGQNRDIFVLDRSAGDQADAAVVASDADDALVGWSPDGADLLFSVAGPDGTELRALPMRSGRPQGRARVLTVLGDPGSTLMLGAGRDGTMYSASCRACTGQLRIAAFDAATGRVQDPLIEVDSVAGNSRPSWSADGTSLVYVARSVRVRSREIVVLAVRSSDTGAVREVVPNLAAVWSPQWAPDGSYILAMGTDLQGVDGFFRIDPRTGAVSTVLTIARGESLNLPQWSNDGTHLYFRLNRPSGSVFLERNLVSGSTRELLQSRTGFATVLVPPARDRLAVTTQLPQTGRWALQIVSMDGGNRHTVVELPAGQEFAGAAFPSADGREFAAIVREPGRSATRVVLISADTGHMRTLLDGPTPQHLPGVWWVPGHRSILFRRTTTNNASEIWRVPLDQGSPHNFGLADSSMMTVVGLRPDGRQIAFEAPAAQRVVEVWAIRNLFPLGKS